MTGISVKGVCERDIDLLLVEEFVASPEFVDWFLSQIGVTSHDGLEEVARSVTTSKGESDLELTVATTRGPLKVLIENKVDAALQPQQAQRYRYRAGGYLQGGRVVGTRTVLIAPRSYVGDGKRTSGFEYCVALEDVLAWFEETSGYGPRAQYKLALLANAIDRARSGWVVVPDENVTSFWRRYWEVANDVAPDLRMKKPGEKPVSSSFIHFYPTGLPKGVTLLHKVTFGNVDLQFAGRADDIGALTARLKPHLEPDMTIEPAGKSAVVRLKVPEIAMSAPFNAVRPLVEKALQAATRLAAWHRRLRQ